MPLPQQQQALCPLQRLFVCCTSCSSLEELQVLLVEGASVAGRLDRRRSSSKAKLQWQRLFSGEWPSKDQRKLWWINHLYKVLGRPSTVLRAQEAIDSAAESILQRLAVEGMDDFSFRLQ